MAADTSALVEALVEKKVLVCLGKRRRAVVFMSEHSKPDKDIIIKRIKEEFNDCLDKRDELLLQVKSEEWPDEWVDLRDNEVQDKTIVKAEKIEVKFVLI